MGRRNLWIKNSIEQIFDAYLAQVAEAGGEILPNDLVNAGLAMFFALDDDAKLRAIERGRNYDLELMRLCKGGEAVAAVEAADVADGQAHKENRRKSGGAKR